MVEYEGREAKVEGEARKSGRCGEERVVTESRNKHREKEKSGVREEGYEETRGKMARGTGGRRDDKGKSIRLDERTSERKWM